MLNADFYVENLDVDSEEEIIKKFQKNLLPTNRSYNFFVDWEKVREHVKKYKYELNLLNSLVGTNNFEEDFEDLLREYPEVVNAMHILIAMRDKAFPVIEDFEDKNVNIKEYEFNVEKDSELSEEEIEEYYEFAVKTGISDLFTLLENFKDYTMGVEVGMDTNARKNRSGKAMELLIKPLIEKLQENIDFDFYYQEKLSILQDKYNIQIPESLKNRTCDFILTDGDNFVNIEVNYYSGTGSKPEEIANSYINRYNSINNSDGSFIWITDGKVWNLLQNQLEVAFNNMPYIMNIYLVRRGLLEKVLDNIFK